MKNILLLLSAFLCFYLSARSQNILTLNSKVRYQVMEGFGASLAFYENWVTAHPNKESMYQLAFNDLGLDWLRIRNTYRYQASFNTEGVEFVQKAQEYTPDSVRILMCSWSPPASLKSNGNVNNGTLLKSNGQFVYDEFGDYWRDALTAYAALGVTPEWISIQNEPDYLTDSWETCGFEPVETAESPGYDKALDAVYGQIQGLANIPKLLGAEMLGPGLSSANFIEYTQPIRNKAHLYAYAYHLYNGGNPDLPDTYQPALQQIAQSYADKPNIMTEYEHYDAGWMKTGWLISNVLNHANASAYFYWDLIWPETSGERHGLIHTDNPWELQSWTSSNGFEPNPPYYAFKHFSKHVKPGYIRISAGNSSSAVRTSAFINPAGDEIVVVLVNTGASALTNTLSLTDFAVNSSSIIQSVDGNFYQDLGALGPDLEATLPGHSMTTLVLNASPVNSILSSTGKGLLQVSPNPSSGFFHLRGGEPGMISISDIHGRAVLEKNIEKELLFGEELAKGVYFVQFRSKNKTETIRIVKN